jgi:CBS domain-containing protein
MAETGGNSGRAGAAPPEQAGRETEEDVMSIEVGNVMGRVAIAVREDAGFAEIVAAMQRYAVGAVTVIDADRRPVGVVSEDDLLLKVAGPARHAGSIFEGGRQRAERRKAEAMTARQLMTAPAITVTPGTLVRDAARLMHAERIKQLPVVDPVSGRIIGTVHQGDLLRVFTRPQEELCAEVVAVAARESGHDPGRFAVTIDGEGVVRLGGQVRRRSQLAHLTEAIRRIDGVIDVVCELTYATDDLIPAGGGSAG